MNSLLRVTEVSWATSFYQHQSLLLLPGLAWRSRGFLVFYGPSPSRSRDLTAWAEIWNNQGSFFLLPQLNFTSSSLLCTLSPQRTPYGISLPLYNSQESARITTVAAALAWYLPLRPLPSLHCRFP